MLNNGPVINRTMMKVTNANALSLIHFPLSISVEIIEKTNKSLKLTDHPRLELAGTLACVSYFYLLN